MKPFDLSAAVAPDLLEALGEVVKWLDDPEDGAFSDTQLEKARAAIKKAMGEE